MHPVARTFQLLFLLAGFALLVAGFLTEDNSKAVREVRLYWTCGPLNGSKIEQKCESDGGGDNLTFANGDENSGITISLAGVGLLVASASVATGARRPQPAQPQPAPYPHQQPPTAPVSY